MKIRYFSDTDTALIEFFDAPVAETREIAQNLYIDLDEKGNLVSMTIEHAKVQANISEVSFLQLNTPEHFNIREHFRDNPNI